MKPSFAILLAVACACFSSCATKKPVKPEEKKEEKKQVVEGPKLVGRIANIPADRRFVLIQRYGEWTTEAGAILTTRGPDARTANLRVTGEKLGDFAAADLQSGTVEKGDAVYSQHKPKPAETPVTTDPAPVEPGVPPELPQAQSGSTEGNIQKNN